MKKDNKPLDYFPPEKKPLDYSFTKNKLRIEVINKYFYPVSAGIEVNVLNTLKYFVNKAKITVITSKDTLNEKNVLKGEDLVEGIVVKRSKTFQA